MLCRLASPQRSAVSADMKPDSRATCACPRTGSIQNPEYQCALRAGFQGVENCASTLATEYSHPKILIFAHGWQELALTSLRMLRLKQQNRILRCPGLRPSTMEGMLRSRSARENRISSCARGSSTFRAGQPLKNKDKALVRHCAKQPTEGLQTFLEELLLCQSHVSGSAQTSSEAGSKIGHITHLVDKI